MTSSAGSHHPTFFQRMGHSKYQGLAVLVACLMMVTAPIAHAYTSAPAAATDGGGSGGGSSGGGSSEGSSGGDEKSTHECNSLEPCPKESKEGTCIQCKPNDLIAKDVADCERYVQGNENVASWIGCAAPSANGGAPEPSKKVSCQPSQHKPVRCASDDKTRCACAVGTFNQCRCQFLGGGADSGNAGSAAAPNGGGLPLVGVAIPLMATNLQPLQVGALQGQQQAGSAGAAPKGSDASLPSPTVMKSFNPGGKKRRHHNKRQKTE